MCEIILQIKTLHGRADYKAPQMRRVNTRNLEALVTTIHKPDEDIMRGGGAGYNNGYFEYWAK